MHHSLGGRRAGHPPRPEQDSALFNRRDTANALDQLQDSYSPATLVLGKIRIGQAAVLKKTRTANARGRKNTRRSSAEITPQAQKRSEGTLRTNSCKGRSRKVWSETLARIQKTVDKAKQRKREETHHTRQRLTYKRADLNTLEASGAQPRSI